MEHERHERERLEHERRERERIERERREEERARHHHHHHHDYDYDEDYYDDLEQELTDALKGLVGVLIISQVL